MNGEKHHLIEYILALLNLPPRDAAHTQRTLSGRTETRIAAEGIRFMDEMPGGFLIYYADGGEEIIYANKALLRIFACRTMEEFREWTKNSFRGLVHPDDLDKVEESIWKQIASSQYDLDYVEYRITRRDGVIRWIEDYGHFIHSESTGDIFYVFLGDATEKRQRMLSEQTELINQEYLRQLEVIKGLSVNYDSILYVDFEKNTVHPYRLSERGGMLLEEEGKISDFQQYISSYIDMWVHPDDREAVRAATNPDVLRERLANCSTFYINYRTREKREVQYLQMRVVNVGDPKQVSQIVLGYRRIDEEIQREMEQRQLMSEALDNANLAIMAKNTFLSNMSHDMRTPLNAVFGFLDFARQTLDDPKTAEGYLNEAERAGRQLLNMIDKVLEMSWAGSSEGDIQEVECSLCEIVQETFDFLRPQADEKGIAFTMDCGGIVHNAVYGDPHNLKQIATYLIDNAITYTNPGGHVSMKVTERKGLSDQYAVYQLVVEDDGIGIGEEFLAHIFEPFMRERNTTYSGVHGVGLGLTITKNIVERMGGSIQAESTPGRGSRFTVTLRLRLQQSETPQHTEMPVQFAGKSVLIVDDNEINLRIAAKIFQKFGFSTDTASDGVEALEKVRGGTHYHLIVMDLQMPRMDGWEAAKAIRRLPDPAQAGIPIVALSANVYKGDVQKSMESGMNAHLRKPIDVPELIRTVSDVLRQYEDVNM